MDWSKANLDTLKEIIRSAEAYLDAQLRLATSADQRAATMASAFTLAGTAIVAGLITLVSSERAASNSHIYIPVYVGGGLAAIMFLIGAVICVLSTMPADFWVMGNEPGNWHDDIVNGDKLECMLGDQANHYQHNIESNAASLKDNAKAFKRGAIIGIAAPFAGALVWLLIVVGQAII